MRFLLGFFVLMSSSVGLSEPVKLVTSSCESKQPVIKGSGILFKAQGDQYIVSSEHATPLRSGLCYSFSTKSGITGALKLVSSDWENGLSLLRVVQPNSNVETGLEDFQAQNVSNEVEVQAIGFPFEAGQPLVDKGRVVLNSSDRSPFYNKFNLIEVVGTRVDYGMSGGALISTSNGKILGILSHQRLIPVLGSPSRISRATPQERNNHILVIPSPVVLEWIRATLGGKLPRFARLGPETIVGDGLIVRELSVPAKQLPLFLAKGGGDGAGVTGESQSSIGIEIELSLAPPEYAQVVQSGDRSQWVQYYREALKGKTVRFEQMILFNRTNGQVRVVPISGLTEFIYQTHAQGAVPLMANSRAHVPSQKYEELRIELESRSNLAQVVELRGILLNLLNATEQLPSFRIPKEVFSAIGAHPGWKDFFSEDFEAGVAARTFLEKLQ